MIYLAIAHHGRARLSGGQAYQQMADIVINTIGNG